SDGRCDPRWYRLQSRRDCAVLVPTRALGRRRLTMAWIDTIPLPALRLDGRKRVREANRGAAKLFERATEKLIGRRRDEIASPELMASASEVPLAKGTL